LLQSTFAAGTAKTLCHNLRNLSRTLKSPTKPGIVFTAAPDLRPARPFARAGNGISEPGRLGGWDSGRL